MSGLQPALDRINEKLSSTPTPVVVALDGRSGVGKSTLATAIADRLGAVVVEGDDFYAGGVGILGDSPESRARRCIDWHAQRRILTALRQGQSATWRAFDWDAFDGRAMDVPTTVEPARLVILEGVYSARPELADLVDLRFLVRVPDTVRMARLLAREGEIGTWETQWHEAEDWYFTHDAPFEGFHLVIDAV